MSNNGVLESSVCPLPSSTAIKVSGDVSGQAPQGTSTPADGPRSTKRPGPQDSPQPPQRVGARLPTTLPSSRCPHVLSLFEWTGRLSLVHGVTSTPKYPLILKSPFPCRFSCYTRPTLPCPLSESLRVSNHWIGLGVSAFVSPNLSLWP